MQSSFFFDVRASLLPYLSFGLSSLSLGLLSLSLTVSLSLSLILYSLSLFLLFFVSFSFAHSLPDPAGRFAIVCTWLCKVKAGAWLGAGWVVLRCVNSEGVCCSCKC